MKKVKILVLPVLTLLLSYEVSMAQSTSSSEPVKDQTTSVPQTEYYNPHKKTPKKLSFLVDGSSVALKGFGFKSTYAVGSNLAIGGLVQRYELNTNDDRDSSFGTLTGVDFKNKVTNFGLVLDYLPTNILDENGLYFSAALVGSRLETKVKSSNSDLDSKSDSEFGYQAKVGYQFVAPINPGLDMHFQLGLGYGTAGAVKNSYTRSFSREVSEASLEPGVLLDLSAGARF